MRSAATFRSRSLAAPTQNPIQRENALPGTSSWGNGDWQDSRHPGLRVRDERRTRGRRSTSTSRSPRRLPRRDLPARLVRRHRRAARRVPAGLPRVRGRCTREACPHPTPSTGELERSAWPVTDTVADPGRTGSAATTWRELVPAGRERRRGHGAVHRPRGARTALADPRRGPREHVAGIQRLGRQEPLRNFTLDGPRAGEPRLSFDRPVRLVADARAASRCRSGSFPLVRFLEREGYDVSYADRRRHRSRSRRSLLRHRLVIVPATTSTGRRACATPSSAARDAGDEPGLHRREHRLLAGALRGRRPDDRRVQVRGTTRSRTRR